MSDEPIELYDVFMANREKLSASFKLVQEEYLKPKNSRDMKIFMEQYNAAYASFQEMLGYYKEITKNGEMKNDYTKKLEEILKVAESQFNEIESTISKPRRISIPTLPRKKSISNYRLKNRSNSTSSPSASEKNHATPIKPVPESIPSWEELREELKKGPFEENIVESAPLTKNKETISANMPPPKPDTPQTTNAVQNIQSLTEINTTNEPKNPKPADTSQRTSKLRREYLLEEIEAVIKSSLKPLEVDAHVNIEKFFAQHNDDVNLTELKNTIDIIKKADSVNNEKHTGNILDKVDQLKDFYLQNSSKNIVMAVADYDHIIFPKYRENFRAVEAAGFNATHRSFQDVLIKPVQAAPRFKLLMEDLKKATPIEHSDYKRISELLEYFKEIAQNLNEARRQQETEAEKRLQEANVFHLAAFDKSLGKSEGSKKMRRYSILPQKSFSKDINSNIKELKKLLKEFDGKPNKTIHDKTEKLAEKISLNLAHKAENPSPDQNEIVDIKIMLQQLSALVHFEEQSRGADVAPSAAMKAIISKVSNVAKILSTPENKTPATAESVAIKSPTSDIENIFPDYEFPTVEPKNILSNQNPSASVTGELSAETPLKQTEKVSHPTTALPIEKKIDINSSFTANMDFAGMEIPVKGPKKIPSNAPIDKELEEALAFLKDLKVEESNSIPPDQVKYPTSETIQPSTSNNAPEIEELLETIKNLTAETPVKMASDPLKSSESETTETSTADTDIKGKEDISADSLLKTNIEELLAGLESPTVKKSEKTTPDPVQSSEDNFLDNNKKFLNDFQIQDFESSTGGELKNMSSDDHAKLSAPITNQPDPPKKFEIDTILKRYNPSPKIDTTKNVPNNDPDMVDLSHEGPFGPVEQDESFDRFKSQENSFAPGSSQAEPSMQPEALPKIEKGLKKKAAGMMKKRLKALKNKLPKQGAEIKKAGADAAQLVEEADKVKALAEKVKSVEDAVLKAKQNGDPRSIRTALNDARAAADEVKMLSIEIPPSNNLVQSILNELNEKLGNLRPDRPKTDSPEVPLERLYTNLVGNLEKVSEAATSALEAISNKSLDNTREIHPPEDGLGQLIVEEKNVENTVEQAMRHRDTSQMMAKATQEIRNFCRKIDDRLETAGPDMRIKLQTLKRKLNSAIDKHITETNAFLKAGLGEKNVTTDNNTQIQPYKTTSNGHVKEHKPLPPIPTKEKITPPSQPGNTSNGSGTTPKPLPPTPTRPPTPTG